MFRNIISVLIYHRHKLLDFTSVVIHKDIFDGEQFVDMG
jgi:hypothetical protein